MPASCRVCFASDLPGLGGIAGSCGDAPVVTVIGDGQPCQFTLPSVYPDASADAGKRGEFHRLPGASRNAVAPRLRLSRVSHRIGFPPDWPTGNRGTGGAAGPERSRRRSPTTPRSRSSRNRSTRSPSNCVPRPPQQLRRGPVPRRARPGRAGRRASPPTSRRRRRSAPRPGCRSPARPVRVPGAVVPLVVLPDRLGHRRQARDGARHPEPVLGVLRHHRPLLAGERPGLVSTASGTTILPTSCSRPASSARRTVSASRPSSRAIVPRPAGDRAAVLVPGQPAVDVVRDERQVVEHPARRRPRRSAGDRGAGPMTARSRPRAFAAYSAPSATPTSSPSVAGVRRERGRADRHGDRRPVVPPERHRAAGDRRAAGVRRWRPAGRGRCPAPAARTPRRRTGRGRRPATPGAAAGRSRRARGRRPGGRTGR